MSSASTLPTISLGRRGEPTNSLENLATLPLLSIGFRVFFLCAAVVACLQIPLWLLMLFGEFAPQIFPPLAHHAHEMLFGFTAAVIAGFLLTASANWTSHRTLTGVPLAALAMLFVGARIGLLLGGAIAPAVAAIDLAFLPLLALILGTQLVRYRSYRNLGLVVLLVALAMAHVRTYAEATTLLPAWAASWALRVPLTGKDLALGAIGAMILLISGRVIPMFTRNATGRKEIGNAPWLDRLAMLAYLSAWFVAPLLERSGSLSWLPTLGPFLLVIAGLLHLLRMRTWGSLHARASLLWVLHLGFALAALSLMLRGLPGLHLAPPSAADHLFTLGGLSLMCLGMMTRVSLGHSGRMLVAPRKMTVAFVSLTLAALVRVSIPWIWPEWSRWAWLLSGGLFVVAFGCFLSFGLPIWWCRRVDQYDTRPQWDLAGEVRLPGALAQGAFLRAEGCAPLAPRAGSLGSMGRGARLPKWTAWTLLVSYSCSPLKDLDLYSRGSDPVAPLGGMGGEPMSLGGLGGSPPSPGGQGGEPARMVCGNGVLDDGEACDDAGGTSKCSLECESRNCPEGCDCRVTEGQLLALCFAELNWAEAQAACEAEGLNLLLPRSQAQNDLVRAWASRAGLPDVWLGGSDLEKEEEWTNARGEVFWMGDALGEAPEGSFESWAVAQPDDGGAGQDCSNLWLDGRWDDLGCDSLRPFICEEHIELGASCGDGQLDDEEACDAGATPNADCDSDCTLSNCGDGIVNTLSGEECDDGNSNALDSCHLCSSTGLVAHYPLTEQLGTTAWDISAAAARGQVLGGATFSPAGLGLTLDGATGYISVDSELAPEVDGEITYLATLRAHIPLAAGPHDLISQNDTSTENWLRIEGPNLQVGTWQSPATFDSLGVNVEVLWPLVQFHHIAARFDGSRWGIYLDGTQVASVLGQDGAIPLSAPLLIGGRPDGGRFFRGVLRDVRIYRRALGAAEIRAIAEAELLAVKSIAEGETASQSTTQGVSVASRSVDGVIDGNFSVGGGSHTSPELAPWWMVELEEPACVSEITLYNRTDCCSDRLDNGLIETSTDGLSFEPGAAFPGTVGVYQTFTFARRTAKFIRVSLVDEAVNRILNMAEVQVHGSSGPCPGDSAE